MACGSGLERIHRFLQSDPTDCEEKTHHVRLADASWLLFPWGLDVHMPQPRSHGVEAAKQTDSKTS